MRSVITLSVGTEYCLFLAFAGSPLLPFFKAERDSCFLGHSLRAALIHPEILKERVFIFLPSPPYPTIFPQLSGPEWGRRMLSQPHHGAALWGIAVQFSL